MSGSETFPGGRYHIVETLPPGSTYSQSWECKAIDPLCGQGFGQDLGWEDCPAITTICPAGPFAGASNPFNGGSVLSGDGAVTEEFPICRGEHIVCRFTNAGVAGAEEEVCLASDNALGDLAVFGGLSDGEVAFSTAAVPVQQANAADSIFLASFTPIADVNHWPGTVEKFVLPLPVVEDADGNLLPDRSTACSSLSEPESCLAWDAGAVVLANQAPSDVTTDRKIGVGAAERRVTYTQAEDSAAPATVPRAIRAFDYIDTVGIEDIEDEKDLWRGLGLPFVEGNATSETNARTQARHIIRETLKVRTVNLVGGGTKDSVLGDFFHGDPLLVTGPQNFSYLAGDPEGNGQPCDATGINFNRGYRCFFERFQRRRKVLLAGANDGQLHAFDAGVFQPNIIASELFGEFDLGTGRELFAHVPRTMLEPTADQVAGTEHGFGVDGSIQIDDVFIDTAHDGGTDPTTGPNEADRRWRTVAIVGYREGAPGYAAIDVTQPDPIKRLGALTQLEFVGDESGAVDGVPGCSALKSSLPTKCAIPYGTVLWEFDELDDPDLGFSWSKPNTGRIRVDVGGDIEVRFVAIFGGGIDPDFPAKGTHLYMVDIETGQVLYKRGLVGAAPSQPAAVDTNLDGIIDTIYMGTAGDSGGFMYKVDISVPAVLNTSIGLIDDLDEWKPFQIFDSGGRELFFPPSVFFDANSASFALAFGSGDREDLWSEAVAGEEGRFYMILDTGFADLDIPPDGLRDGGVLTEANFLATKAASANAGTDEVVGTVPLVAPEGIDLPGWVLELGPDERVVTDALAISGLLVFSTFDPDRPSVCQYAGDGLVYALNSTTSNSIAGVTEARAISVGGLAGAAVVTSTGFSQAGAGGGEATDPFDATRIQQIRQSMMSMFPSNCRFGSFSLSISTALSGRTQLPIAQVPICIVPKNWKEF